MLGRPGRETCAIIVVRWNEPGHGETQIRLFAEEVVSTMRERPRLTPPAWRWRGSKQGLSTFIAQLVG